MSGPKNVESAAVRSFRTYPAYKDSDVDWLGEVPSHWQVKTLKRLARLRAGTTINSEVIKEVGDYPVFGGNGIRGFTSSFTHEGNFPLVGRQGALCGCVNFASGRFWASEHALVASPGVGVSAFWLTYLLRAMPLNDYAQSAAQPGLTVEGISSLSVALPSMAEQKEIAAFLDRETAQIDALIAKKRHLIELLSEKRNALIDKSVMKSSDPRPSQPPWVLTQLRRVIRSVRRPVLIEAESDYQEIGIRSWGKGIFHKNPLKGSQLEEKSVFYIKRGDLVFNIVFAWEGAVAVAGAAEDGLVGSHRFPTFRPDEDKVDLDYLLMFLQSKHGRALMGLNSPGAAGRNRTIRMDSFLNEEIPLPTLLEQRRIVTQFRQQERLFETLRDEAAKLLDRLTELKLGLISAAVTGKIDVRDRQAS